MPATSRRERIAQLQRALLSPNRWIDALLVVVSHEGEELFRVGGCWDRELRTYVDRPCKLHTIKLQESQRELGRALGAWFKKRRAGLKRERFMIAGGNRGSGKTWFMAGVAMTAMALEYPNEVQFGVTINVKQKRECMRAIQEVAPPAWILSVSEDLRDPQTVFLTNNTIIWYTSKNPAALRQAGLPICYVLLNEAQKFSEEVAGSSIALIRNLGGLVGLACNPPQSEAGDWVANWWTGIDEGNLNGCKFFVDNTKNKAIDQDAVADIYDILVATSPEQADSDGRGNFHLAGNLAYPAFSSLSRERGGHIGDPPKIGWTNVTRQYSAEAVDGDVGYEYLLGCDWQKTPGVAGALAQLWRDERGELVLYILDQIAVKGVEADFSQALFTKGFSPVEGGGGPSVLLIGDATGARQNAEHKWKQPASFTAMRTDGWVVLPPMLHAKTRVPWNPFVRDSRAQMHECFEKQRILISPKCKEPNEGFASLIDSFKRAKVGPRGGLVEKGGYQHGPDTVRYLAWRFLPRPAIESKPIDKDISEAIASIRFMRQ